MGLEGGRDPGLNLERRSRDVSRLAATAPGACNASSRAYNGPHRPNLPRPGLSKEYTHAPATPASPVPLPHARAPAAADPGRLRPGRLPGPPTRRRRTEP